MLLLFSLWDCPGHSAVLMRRACWLSAYHFLRASFSPLCPKTAHKPRTVRYQVGRQWGHSAGRSPQANATPAGIATPEGVAPLPCRGCSRRAPQCGSFFRTGRSEMCWRRAAQMAALPSRLIYGKVDYGRYGSSVKAPGFSKCHISIIYKDTGVQEDL